MGFFDMSATTGAKESGNVLTPGIKNAKFKGITRNVVDIKGSPVNALTISFDVEGYGEYSTNFLEPKSNERPQGPYGAMASPRDHFLIAVREILDALDPKFGEQIDNGGIKELNEAPNFGKFVTVLTTLTNDYVGEELQIKILPQRNGFNGIPNFPARVTRNGELGIATKFIGKNLTLTDREVTAIENAKNATPTPMPKTEDTGLIDDIKDGLGLNDEPKEDDLPF